MDYRADLFDPHTIATLIQHFTVLLQSIVTSPDIPIQLLEMRSSEENEQRLKKEVMRQEADRHKLKVTKRRMITLTENDFESVGGSGIQMQKIGLQGFSSFCPTSSYLGIAKRVLCTGRCAWFSFKELWRER